MMIWLPSVLVAALNMGAALFLIYEGRKKTSVLYRWRWTFSSIPFFAQSCAYGWAAFFFPQAFQEYPCFFYSAGTIGLMATLYFLMDLYTDITTWRQTHGPKPY